MTIDSRWNRNKFRESRKTKNREISAGRTLSVLFDFFGAPRAKKVNVSATYFKRKDWLRFLSIQTAFYHLVTDFLLIFLAFSQYGDLRPGMK